MRTILIGNRAILNHLLERALADDWHIVGVVKPADTTVSNRAGTDSIAALADRAGAELIETEAINSDTTRSLLRNLAPDLCLCPAWSQIIDGETLSIPERDFLGFHASKLPRGRGGAPLNWSLIEGRDELHLSLFSYAEDVDAGDVIGQKSVEIEDRDDISTLWEKVSDLACQLMAEIRDSAHDDVLVGDPQDLSKATYRPRRQPQDGIVEWSRPASRLRDWIRALTHPYPGAFTFHDGDRINIWDADVRSTNGKTSADPGEICAVEQGAGIDVCTGDGVLRLTRMQRNGGPCLWADAMAERFDIKTGDRFSRDAAPPEWYYTGIRGPDGSTDFDTNVETGDRGIVRAIVESPTRSRRIDVEISFGDRSITRERVTGRGRSEVVGEYVPDSRGKTALEVTFQADGEQVDRRYLAVYTPD